MSRKNRDQQHGEQQHPTAQNAQSGTKGRAWKTSAAVAACLAVGAGAGYLAGLQHTLPAVPATVIRTNSSDYQFINPVLLFTIGDKEDFPEYKPLESKLNDYIAQAKAAGKVTDVSVYYRNLTNETWTGVNEDDKYAPSSMLKVAVLIAYLKLSETDPSIMDKVVHYVAQVDPGQYFKPKNPIPTGDYTNAQLLQNMIAESDNVSLLTLLNNQPAAVTQVYSDLHLPTPTSPTDIDFMSAKLYSRLFRVLYNGSYLTPELSEKALTMLSETDFAVGLIDGLPSTTVIAHKFGERTVYSTTDGSLLERELHDCGIVYQPNNPYFICVMTRGKDFDQLESVISDISDLVYQNNVPVTAVPK